MTVEKIEFRKDKIEDIKKTKHGTDWPAVYIIRNKKEAYVGETVDVARRASQHLQSPERKQLEELCWISDETFNKSATLDLEAFLIKHMASDGKYILQNGNAGLSDHNYYKKEEYEKRFEAIWEELKSQGLAESSLEMIRNSALFKYSPYKSLTEEQAEALSEILGILKKDRESQIESTILVDGEAGTGKTILAVYLMKLLSEINLKVPYYDPEEIDFIDQLAEDVGKLRFALVIPQQSLRKTIQKVFKSVKGLSPQMVISPYDVPKEQYDVLIIDEAHRLKQRKALANYSHLDKNNKALGLQRTSTELDWMIKCSRTQILFYDSMQSIKPSDIEPEHLLERVKKRNYRKCTLKSQLRCLGGNDYLKYIKAILSDLPPKEKETFAQYEIQLFSDVEEMREAIKVKDQEYGLCRNVAGFAWEWVTKGSKKESAKVPTHDIVIGKNKYRWNSTSTDWVNSPKAPDEIGCIHTVQGYDLNYVGVIFGDEIKYDKETSKIVIEKKSYYDKKGKTDLKNDEELKQYILNIYITLMTRGVRGAYVYACDENLREYFRKFF